MKPRITKKGTVVESISHAMQLLNTYEAELKRKGDLIRSLLLASKQLNDTEETNK